MYHKGLMFMFTVLAMSACASTPLPVTSPDYLLPVGSKLRMLRELEIPAGKARVYLQYGGITTYAARDKYEAHCWFLSNYVKQTPQLIRRGEFLITRNMKYENTAANPAPLRYAAASAPWSGQKSEGGPIVVDTVTRFELSSAEQPDILRLECGRWGDMPLTEHLTLAEIREALGDYAEFILPQ